MFMVFCFLRGGRAVVTIKLTQKERKQLGDIANDANASINDIASGIVKIWLSGPLKRRIPFQKIPIIDQLGQEYSSVKEASKVLGLETRLIDLVLRGQRRSTGGYVFRYA
jgi:hypothetical protein